jgi:hypothetical protein
MVSRKERKERKGKERKQSRNYPRVEAHKRVNTVAILSTFSFQSRRFKPCTKKLWLSNIIWTHKGSLDILFS